MAKKKAVASAIPQTKSDLPAKRPEPTATGAGRPEEPDTRRIMREAAWRQMFGNTQAKNPFDH